MVERIKSKRAKPTRLPRDQVKIVKDKKGRFAKGMKPPGRAAGTPNRTTRILKEAVIMAAEQVGEDGKGKDALLGYLRNIARADFKTYTQLLLKVLPLQITGDAEKPVVLTLDEKTLAAMSKKSPEKLEILRDVLKAIGITSSGQIPADFITMKKPGADPGVYGKSLRVDSPTDGRA